MPKPYACYAQITLNLNHLSLPSEVDDAITDMVCVLELSARGTEHGIGVANYIRQYDSQEEGHSVIVSLEWDKGIDIEKIGELVWKFREDYPAGTIGSVIFGDVEMDEFIPANPREISDVDLVDDLIGTAKQAAANVGSLTEYQTDSGPAKIKLPELREELLARLGL